MNWPDDFIVSEKIGKRNGRILIKCRNCLNEHEIYQSRIPQRRGQFCSKDCFLIFRSKIMIGKENPNYKKALIQKICLKCGSKFKTFLSVNSDYCSDECRQLSHGDKIRADKHPNWKGGIGKFPYPFEFNEELKESIRKRDNHKCQKCFIHQSQLNRKLDVHHRDGNKNNLNPENLISYCLSCHIKRERNNEKTNMATELR